VELGHHEAPRPANFYLYVLLDIFSRYVVGWMVAHRESATLAKKLIEKACQRQGIAPGQLAIHGDRGPSMTSKMVAHLYADLGQLTTWRQARGRGELAPGAVTKKRGPKPPQNRGIYNPTAHLRKLGGMPLAIDGRWVFPEAVIEVNQRRLQRLARYNLVAKLPDGTWRVPPNLVEVLEAESRPIRSFGLRLNSSGDIRSGARTGVPPLSADTSPDVTVRSTRFASGRVKPRRVDWAPSAATTLSFDARTLRRLP
jgi:hypothetical protein